MSARLDRAALAAMRDRERAALETFAPRVFCCSGTGCHATGSLPLIAALREEAARQGGAVQVVETGCNGFCALGPVVIMQPGGILYCKVRAQDAADVIASAGGRPVERLLYRDPEGNAVAGMDSIPFFALQRPWILRNKGRIDPENIGHAIAHEAYQGLAKALFDMTPEGGVEEVRASGLRGRGGAGFPTGLNGSSRPLRPATSSTCSATPTKATGRVHGPLILESAPPPCSKACSSRPWPSFRVMATHCLRNTPWPSIAYRRHRQPGNWVCWREHPGQRFFL
jgi:(2Fe-2S) ferredoxin